MHVVPMKCVGLDGPGRKYVIRYDTIRYSTMRYCVLYFKLHRGRRGPFFCCFEAQAGQIRGHFSRFAQPKLRETGLLLQAGKGLPMMPALAGGAKNGCPFSSEVVELVVFVWCRAACERAELSRVAVCVA